MGRVTNLAPAPVDTTAPTEVERPESDILSETWTALERPWVTLVWNDPVNLMSYVAYVFRTYFGYPQSKADELMLAVHHEGRAAVSAGTREEMERDVTAMHGYGLWATLQQDD
jgi:ATP-dependent Clp protease adaptor protein ClpS